MPRWPDVYEAAQAQNQLWTPLDERGRLLTYVDVRSPCCVKLESGAISQMNDLAKGNHYTQSIAAERPTLEIDYENGVRVARFDGTNDHVDQASALDSSAGPWSMFFMMRAGAFSDNNSGYVCNTDNTNGTVQTSEQGSDKIGMKGTSDGGDNEDPLFDPIEHVEGRLYLLSYEFGSSRSTMYSDGIQVGIDTNDFFTGGRAVSTRIGASRGLTKLAALDLYTLVIFSGELEDDLRRKLNAWAVWSTRPTGELLDRLPLDNPYRNQPPLKGA